MHRLLVRVMLLALGIVFLGLPVRDASAFCTRTTIGFPVDCSEEGHDEITEQALDFLSGTIVALIANKNTDQDSGAASDKPERHSTNCLFAETVDYINERYGDIVASLDPSSPNSGEAATHWGLLFHPIQDFYSHSAWVDPPPVGLGFGTGSGRRLEGGLGEWQLPGPYQRLFNDEDVVIVQGLPPAGSAIDLPRDENGEPTSAVPIVTIDGTPFRGLMTASAEPIVGGLGQCPEDEDSLPASNSGEGDCTDAASVCIRHGGDCDDDEAIFGNCLHHDRGHRPMWLNAFNAAVVQTEHEWCRLLHLLKGDDGNFARASVPLSLWVTQDQLFASAGSCGGDP